MKVFAVLLAGLTALAIAQSPTSNSPPSTTSVARTPQQTCLDTCNPADSNCRAACLGVPHPNEANANATTECAARCDQGDGSPAATERYAQCQQACISSNFPISGTVAPPAGSAGASNAASSALASATGSALSALSSAAASGTEAANSAASAASSAAASATRSGSASANGVTFGAAGFGSLLMALFAL